MTTSGFAKTPEQDLGKYETKVIYNFLCSRTAVVRQTVTVDVTVA